MGLFGPREAVDVVDIVDVVDERLRMGDMTAANVVDAHASVWVI